MFVRAMGESVADFERRHQWLCDWNGARCDWVSKGPMDVAFTLEALGATAEGFERVLRLAHQMGPGFCPAGLCDVAQGYRIGVAPDHQSTSGEPLGRYLDAVVLAWTITSSTPRRPKP